MMRRTETANDADLSTIAGDLPPSSSVTGVRCLAAASCGPCAAPAMRPRRVGVGVGGVAVGVVRARRPRLCRRTMTTRPTRGLPVKKM